MANGLCAAGRVFEFVHGTDNAQPLVTQRNVSEIVQALLASLQDEPHIAEKVCYALSQLAAGSKQEDGLSLLSPYFKEIIQALLTTVRPSPCSRVEVGCCQGCRMCTACFTQTSDLSIVGASRTGVQPLRCEEAALQVFGTANSPS